MQYSNNILEKYESRPRKWWLYTLIVFIMALLLSWSASSVTFKGFAAKGTEVAKGIFWGLVKPDMNLLFSTSTDGVPYLLMETVCIAILGTVVGGILALPISFLASPKIMPKPVAFIFNALILLIRTLPSIVWALIWIPEPCVGACVDPRDRAGRVLRRGDAVHLLHRHDFQDVYHRHRRSGYEHP